jgi:hypothetical protein
VGFSTKMLKKHAFKVVLYPVEYVQVNLGFTENDPKINVLCEIGVENLELSQGTNICNHSKF